MKSTSRLVRFAHSLLEIIAKIIVINNKAITISLLLRDILNSIRDECSKIAWQMCLPKGEINTKNHKNAQQSVGLFVCHIKTVEKIAAPITITEKIYAKDRRFL